MYFSKCYFSIYIFFFRKTYIMAKLNKVLINLLTPMAMPRQRYLCSDLFWESRRHFWTIFHDYIPVVVRLGEQKIKYYFKEKWKKIHVVWNYNKKIVISENSEKYEITWQESKKKTWFSMKYIRKYFTTKRFLTHYVCTY